MSHVYTAQQEDMIGTLGIKQTKRSTSNLYFMWIHTDPQWNVTQISIRDKRQTDRSFLGFLHPLHNIGGETLLQYNTLSAVKMTHY